MVQFVSWSHGKAFQIIFPNEGPMVRNDTLGLIFNATDCTCDNVEFHLLDFEYFFNQVCLWASYSPEANWVRVDLGPVHLNLGLVPSPGEASSPHV